MTARSCSYRVLLVTILVLISFIFIITIDDTDQAFTRSQAQPEALYTADLI